MVIEIERWRDIPGYERLYMISDRGQVRNHSKVLRSYISRGYRRIELSRNGRAKKHQVHLLVLAAFVGPCPFGNQGNHKDGNKVNNRLNNLEYVTRSENALHACRILGTHRQKGSAHGMHKLTEIEVHQILRRLLHSESLEEIAKRYHVSIATVSMIGMNRTWRHIPRESLADRRKR